ncbi:hypothetical protein F2982_15175 [Rhizobium sp. BG4]|nr:hypothetical protein F2982_15175 [Rhizobium sp. BG4]
MRLRRAAHAIGRRYALHRRYFAGTPDFVVVKHMLVFYVHSCFWYPTRYRSAARSRVVNSPIVTKVARHRVFAVQLRLEECRQPDRRCCSRQVSSPLFRT